jgi:alpha-ketoglutarate-dependent taurine dioxygenase
MTTNSGPVSVWRPDSRTTLPDFAERHESDITAELMTRGAILFRDFPRISDAEFRDILTRFGGPALEYSERSSPRKQLSDRVYSSTEYAADQEIFFHNENSYQIAWPKLLGFICREPADSGGETLVADCRSVLAGLDQLILAEFTRHGWAYVRNFYPGLGLPWQEVFGTTDRSAVDQYCRSHQLQPEWIGKSRLRVFSGRRAAIATHPVTGQSVWFNHAAFFHYSTLPAEISDTLYGGMPTEDLPANSYLGNREPISQESMAVIRQAYRAASQSVAWAADDVLVIDNMMMAHARRPFTGDRRISVAMAGAIEAKDVTR